MLENLVDNWDYSIPIQIFYLKKKNPLENTYPLNPAERQTKRTL